MGIAVWCHDHHSLWSSQVAAKSFLSCHTVSSSYHGETRLPGCRCLQDVSSATDGMHRQPRPHGRLCLQQAATPLRKPPITSRIVQAKRTRKSNTQQCQSDSEHFCSGQVRLQVASCVAQCPRSSRWASSSCARNSTEGSGSEKASESPPRSTPNQGKQLIQIATARTVRGVELGAITIRTRKRRHKC